MKAFLVGILSLFILPAHGQGTLTAIEQQVLQHTVNTRKLNEADIALVIPLVKQYSKNLQQAYLLAKEEQKIAALADAAARYEQQVSLLLSK